MKLHLLESLVFYKPRGSNEHSFKMSSNERHTHHIKAYTRILQFVISIEKKIGCRIVGSYARIDNSDICITKKFKFKDKVKLNRLLWTGYLIRVREKALPPLISWRVPKC